LVFERVDAIQEHNIALVNTTEHATQASLCYSAGDLYTPRVVLAGAPQLAFICSVEIQVQIPPYAARMFPVQRADSTQFSITTQGEAIVLQMIHPLDTGVKLYTVDSAVKFRRELTPGKWRFFSGVRNDGNIDWYTSSDAWSGRELSARNARSVRSPAEKF